MKQSLPQKLVLKYFEPAADCIVASAMVVVAIYMVKFLLTL